jgi:MscS family membrane protein
MESNIISDLKHYLTENQILETQVFLMPTGKWLLLFLILFVGFSLQKLVQLAWPKILRFTSRTKMTWDDDLVKISRPYSGRIISGLFMYGALRAGDFLPKITTGLGIFIKLYIGINIILLIYSAVDVLMNVLKDSTKHRDLHIDEQVFSLLHKTLKIFIIVFGFLVMIQNFGINVVSLLAGLGLGGLAFALAAQDTCANFFGSIMILTDKPFRVGDFIKVNSIEGVVEEVGFRSTKIRTFYSSLVTVPNAEMAKASVDNMGARKYRRTRFFLGLDYNTNPEKMMAFVNGVKQIIRSQPRTYKDDYDVAFDNYGDFSLNVLVNFFLDSPTGHDETEDKQKILLEIYQLADRLQVGFAFPTQTLHISQS